MQNLIDQHAQLINQYEIESHKLNQMQINTITWFEQLQVVTEKANAILALTYRIERSQ